MIFCRTVLFMFLVFAAGCAVRDDGAWICGVAGGAYFSYPAEKVFAPGMLPEAESCFDGEYIPLRQELALNALKEISEYFAARGIYFLVVLYPDPWEVARAELTGGIVIPNSVMAAEELRASGINVIAPWQEILDLKDTGLWFYYDVPFDPHPDVPVQKAVAGVLAGHLRGRVELPGGDTANFSISGRESLARRRDPLNGEIKVDEIVLFHGKPPVFRHRESPVLIFGNSLCATPSGNELAARLGMELGFMPDCIRIDGTGLAKSMARYFAPDTAEEFRDRQAVILAMSVNQLYERWLSPGAVIAASVAAAERQNITLQNWQGRFSCIEEYDGILPFISRAWRSADRLTPEEEAAVDFWRNTAKDLADMPVVKNGAPATFCWNVPEIPAGRERVLNIGIFTAAPPGYVLIDVLDAVTGDTVFTTVNTGEADKLKCSLPDAASAIRIMAKITLPECIFAIGELSVSTLQ